MCCATEEFKGHRLNHPPCPVEAFLKAILGNRKGVSAWEGQTMFPNYLQIRHLDHEMGRLCHRNGGPELWGRQIVQRFRMWALKVRTGSLPLLASGSTHL